jgi:hypothetical protein
MNPQRSRNRPAPPPIPRRGAGEAPAIGDPGLDALLRHSPDGLLISDDCGQIVFASQVAAEALGFDSPGALMAAPLEHLAQRFVIEEPSGPAAPDAPLPGHEVFRGLPEPDRLLRFRDPSQGWDRWALLRTARSAKHIGQKRAVLTMVRDISVERRREVTNVFLAEASSRLGRSLAADRVLEHAVVVAVPHLGDECVIVARLPTTDSPLGPVAWHIPTQQGEERARALVRTFAAQITQVEATGRALRVAPTFDGPTSPGSGSMVLAPVTDDLKRKEVDAVMLLAMAQDTGRRHHPSDLSLAEQLGQRVGHALANAQVLEGERRRRGLLEESEAWARQLSQALEAQLANVQRELEIRLSPLIRAVDLLERPGAGPQRQLVEIVKRQADNLRDLTVNLREAPPRLETAEITLPNAPRFRQ